MNEMAYSYEVFLGTYEHFLLSYKIKKPETEAYLLDRFIAHRTHTSSIRCIDAKGRYLATGGSDDRICIMDLKLNQEIQMLSHHMGNVNHLKFTPDLTHLLSVSEDGSLVAVKTGSWILHQKWAKAHTNKPITHISVHPTGRLALTLGKDDTVRTWNLITGQQAFTTNLKTLTPLGTDVICIEWSPNGQFFAIANKTTILILSLESAQITQEITSEHKLETICWLSNDTILGGLCNGQVMFARIGSDKKVLRDVFKGSRVKAMDFANNSLLGILATVTSCGQLSIWNVSIKKMQIKLLCTTNIGCRPTCLTLVNASVSRKKTVVKEETEDSSIVTETDQPLHIDAPSMSIGKVTVEMGADQEDDSDEMPIIEKLKARRDKKKKKKKKKKGLIETSIKMKKKKALIETSIKLTNKKKGFSPLN